MIGDCFFGYEHAVRRGGKGTSEFLRSSALEQTSRGGMITQLANLVLSSCPGQPHAGAFLFWIGKLCPVFAVPEETKRGCHGLQPCPSSRPYSR